MSEAVVIAEQSVLGAVMLSPRASREVCLLLTTADFYVPKHGLIFDSVLRLHGTGDPTDVVAITDDLIKAGELDRAGGAEYLHHLTSVTPTAANAGYYAGIIRDEATRREAVTIGERLAATSAEGEPGVAVAKAIEALRSLRDRGALTEHTVRTLRDVLGVEEKDDAYDWVVPGLLERRDRAIITGSEGAGKSMILKQTAILSAAGIHPFRFSPIEPIRALVVDVENSEKQWRRAVRRMTDEAAVRGGRDPRDYVALECLPRLDIVHASDLGRIHRKIDEAKPDLLVIGPLYRLIPRAINSDDDAAPVLAALDSLRDRGVAMLIEAHAGHAMGASGDRDLRPRGSSALLGWPEFGLGLRRDKNVGPGGRVHFELVPWRGAREWGRSWPTKLSRGQVWPWEPVAPV